MKWKALAGVAIAMSLVVAPLTAGAASATNGGDDGRDSYVLVLWKADNSGETWPQSLVTSISTNSDSLSQLDQAATEPCALYQVDLYANDARTAALIAGGFLNGPNDPDESWPGGKYKPEFAKQWSTSCQPPENPGPRSGSGDSCTGAGERSYWSEVSQPVWNEATWAWEYPAPTRTTDRVVYDVRCAVEVTPVPPTWVDPCGPGNGHWEYPANPVGYSYHAWSVGKWRNVTILPSPFDGYYLKPFTKLTYSDKDSKKPCAEGDKPTPVPAQFNAEPLAADCGVPGSLAPDVVAGDYPRVTVTITTGEDSNTRVITVTPKEGFYLEDVGEGSDWTENEDGSVTRVVTLAAAIPDDSEECALVPGDIESQCVGSVPYLAYAVSLPEGFETDSENPVTITFVNPDGEDYVVTDQPLEGKLLWPGASAGTPQQWPGWVHNADGTYSETDGNFAWTRAAEGVTVHFKVNPESEATVFYPAESELCANPANDPSTPVAALPATGGTDMTPWGIAAAVMLIAGAALIVTRRRLVRR